MKVLYKLLLISSVLIMFNQNSFADDVLKGKELRENIIKRLPKLNHNKIEALMKRVGKKVPKNFYSCLCRRDGGGASSGVGISYHPEIIEPYDERYTCQHYGYPCMAQGYGCWRFPLPNDINITNYCIEHSKYDDNTTIVDVIFGEAEKIHLQQNRRQKYNNQHPKNSENIKNSNIIVSKSFAECPIPSCWIQEAQDQLRQAISDSNPLISKEERIRIIKRSAITLKEYGQSPNFLKKIIPIMLPQDNYIQSRKDLEGINSLLQLFSGKLLNQKLKFINELQIEVVGEQISFLIPGNTTFSMSKNLVQTIFDWDIVGGTNKGRFDTVHGLVKKFRELAKTKTIVKKLTYMQKDLLKSTKLLSSDYKKAIRLQEELVLLFWKTYNSTFTIK